MRLLPSSSPGRKVRALAMALLAGGLGACSLSLEDPEVEARKKLAKLVEPTWERLEGRWLGDSTYTVFDIRAADLRGSMILDIFPDSTFWSSDSTRLVMPGSAAGPARLSGDTLVLRQARLDAAPDTFAVRMRFLGNYLELYRKDDQRHSHFHKSKPFDSASVDSLLDTSLWIRRLQRIAHDTLRTDSLRRDFDYLRFSGDSLQRDARRAGISTVVGGPLRRDGRRWSWHPATGTRALHLDLYHRDTLRLWTLAGGRPDSGYSLFVRTRARAPFDLDMTPWAGHLRLDSLRTPLERYEAHFGRYYDLALGRDHGVATYTSIPGLPDIRAWSIDSGSLVLEGKGGMKSRIRVETPAPGILKLETDSGRGFHRPTTLWFSLADGEAIAADPLERFAQAGYMHLAIGTGDTLKYYFNASSNSRAAPEEHEIARIDTVDTLWAAWRLNASLETFGSGQPGFLFAFQGRSGALGRFTCRGVPSLDLAIRSLASPDPTLARGLVQGSCRLVAAERGMPADSALAFTGEFRSERRAGPMLAPLWRLP